MGYPGYGAGYTTSGQVEAAQQAYEQRMREDHAEGVQEHQAESTRYQQLNEQFPLSTNFNSFGLKNLKAMLADSNPDGVDDIGRNWKRVHDKLVGAGGGAPSGDSAYGQLKKAVDDVLEHWEGESANQFKVKAEKILQNIANSASHASTVSEAMTAASKDLRTQKDAINAIEEPGFWDRAIDKLTDPSRDDTYSEQDIRSGNLPKDVIAEVNEDYLSAGKEAQLKAVAVMENLGRSYVAYSQRAQAPRTPDDGSVPPSSPDTPMPTPIPAVAGTASSPSSSRAARTNTSQAATAKAPETTRPRDPAISGGQQVPTSQTKVDSLPSGITGGTGGAAGGGAVSGVGAGGGGSVGGGAVTGVPGGGVAGGAAAAGAARGAAGAARGTAGPAGRTGMVGGGAMGGRGGAAAGIGGKGAAGSSGRGALAKTKGGVAGAPRGIVGGRPATPGGTGLGKGRAGAAGAAGGAGRKGVGMFAGARGTNQRPDEEERTEGQRPDYLVEDEETWTPEDNRSVPKTVE